LREFAAYAEPAESAYYDPIYAYRLRWNDVIYEPGELKAVAYKDGHAIGTAVMRTAGKPAAIRVTPDRTKLIASGDDLSFVLVEAIDEAGVICPLADDAVEFTLSGPAEIAGVGNGDPVSLEPFQADKVTLFYGKAMLILRTHANETGEVQVVGSADGLAAGEAKLDVQPVKSTP
jgi:beta-galactosidase